MIHLQVINAMLMTLNSIYHSRLLTSHTVLNAQLEQTVSFVYNWMSSNFLSLNPSKTEFLVIGLPKQLEKLDHPTIHLPNDVIFSLVDSSRDLAVIFDSKLTFLIVLLLCLNHAYITFETSDVSAIPPIVPQRVP